MNNKYTKRVREQKTLAVSESVLALLDKKRLSEQLSYSKLVEYAIITAPKEQIENPTSPGPITADKYALSVCLPAYAAKLLEKKAFDAGCFQTVWLDRQLERFLSSMESVIRFRPDRPFKNSGSVKRVLNLNNPSVFDKPGKFID